MLAVFHFRCEDAPRAFMEIKSANRGERCVFGEEKTT